MYRLVSFGALLLPIYNAVSDQQGGEAPSTAQRTINGYYDLRGATRAHAGPATYRVRGTYTTGDTGETVKRWARGNGDRFVASAGNPLVMVLRGPGEVRAQLDALRALLGTVSTLYRSPMAGSPTGGQFTMARLLSVSRLTNRKYGVNAVDVEITFEAIDPCWYGEARTASGLVLHARAEGNAPVRTATLTITGAAASCAVSGAGSAWSFAGAGQTLVVTGNQVTANGVPTTVTIAAGHTIDTLVELQPGLNIIKVTGALAASLTWRDAWL